MHTNRKRNTLTKKSLLALVAACSLLGGRFARAADEPKAKQADVQKMEAALPDKAPAEPKEKRKVLVYGNANGFVHSSIPLGEESIAKLGEKTGAYTATLTTTPPSSTPTTQELRRGRAGEHDQATSWSARPKRPRTRRPEKQRMENLVDFVEKDGKGLIGIHAATDAYYDDRAYGDLIGGYFNGHHAGQEKIAVVNVTTPRAR